MTVSRGEDMKWTSLWVESGFKFSPLKTKIVYKNNVTKKNFFKQKIDFKIRDSDQKILIRTKLNPTFGPSSFTVKITLKTGTFWILVIFYPFRF